MLKTNGYRDGFSPLRRFGAGILINGAYPQVSQYPVGSTRNIFAGEGGINTKSAIPAGARNPVAWQMPQKDGGLASRNNAKITLTNTGFAVMGLPSSGSATITLDIPDATGGLIVSGSGLANVTLTLNGTILSVASATGSTNITLSSTALIGAQAGIAGSTTFVLAPVANISAIGYMSGLSTSETEFSASALANAVWQAEAASYDVAGTMGEKLNDAGSGSNPWTEVIESGLTAAEVIRIILAVQAGKSSIGSGTVTFRDVADTKDRVTATMTGSERTTVVLDGG